MVKTNLKEIKNLIKSKDYQKAIINTHDLVQLVIYQGIISALWFLGEEYEMKKYLRKIMKVSKKKTFREKEIERALELQIINDKDLRSIKGIKDLRDSIISHYSTYFNSETDAEGEKKDEVIEIINAGEKVIHKLQEISDRIGVARIKESRDFFNNSAFKVADYIHLGNSQKDLLELISKK